MEMVGGKWKTYVGVGLEFPWAFGYSLLPGIAYILPVSLTVKIVTCQMVRDSRVNCRP